MTEVQTIIMPAMTGIILQEALQWYKIFGLDGRSRAAMKLKRPGYWVVFLVTCVVGTTAIYYYTGGDPHYQQRDVLILGASLPTLVRQFLAGAKAHQNQNMGGGWSFLNGYLV